MTGEEKSVLERRFWSRSAMSQRTNPLWRECLAARSGDYVCRSNYLNERKGRAGAPS
jgi:hypothetical protein